MSTNIAFAGPFIKRMFFGDANSGRRGGNPIQTSAYTDTVPVPHRRTYLLIQNQGLAEATILLDPEGDADSGIDTGIKLLPGQTISFDNFNVGFEIVTGGNLNTIVIGEAFA